MWGYFVLAWIPTGLNHVTSWEIQYVLMGFVLGYVWFFMRLVYSIVMKNDTLPRDVRGLDSLAFNVVVYKNGNDLFIVMFYDILIKVLVIIF